MSDAYRASGSPTFLARQWGYVMILHDTEQCSAVVTAASALAALSDRMSRVAQSRTRIVARRATDDDAADVVRSTAQYEKCRHARRPIDLHCDALFVR
jgi:hypothetical protein